MFIELKNLTKIYNKYIAVNKINFEIEKNKTIGLLGPNGCGKTTTMRMIAGLEDATDGEILVDGKKINDLEPKDRDVAMVFQSYALYPNMNVYDNIRFPLKVRGIDKSTHNEKVMRAVKMVELENFLHRKPAELSGGQRQRVALARAIVREPNVFLMDEPLSNLDAKLRVSTRAQIKNLSHELAVTTVYVTHDQVEAMTLADRVVVMREGIIQQVGSPTEIYDNPANAFVASFIGSPAMNLIDGEVKNKKFTADLTSVSGLNVENSKVTLGFRAEDASVVKSGGQINAPIYTLEILGDATMVTVKIGQSLVSIKTEKDYRANIEDYVSIHIPSKKCHLFDHKTGDRIGR